MTEIDYDNIFSIFKLFLNHYMIDFIISEANKYEKCETQAPSLVSRKHKQQWTPTTRDIMNV